MVVFLDDEARRQATPWHAGMYLSIFLHDMKNPIISVHIPKTGGSTLKDMIAALPNVHAYFDYEDKPLAPPRQLRRIRNEPGNIIRYLRISRSLNQNDAMRIFIHGHFLASKYDQLFPAAGFATWLRHPVERLVSHYHHWLRHPDMKHEVCRRLIVEKLSLAEFSEMEEMRNVHSRFLNGKNPDHFDFIGITEDYDRGMALFVKLFALQTTHLTLAAKNQNPNRSGNLYEIDEKTRDRITACNELDLVLYEKGKRRFKDLCDSHGV